MNAPLPESVLKALASLSLEDKYAQEQGRVFMSGIQALVRLPMLQHTRDTMAGLHTAGFISGYRGSPLGGYDQALWKARDHLEAHNVVFQPGVNEELGATAVWGSSSICTPSTSASTASSASGTARARGLTAVPMSSSTPTWPAPRGWAA